MVQLAVVGQRRVARAPGAQGDPSAAFVKGERRRLFPIYSAGNFIEATPETRSLQAGETKYGKPILDRVITSGLTLAEGAKCVLLSFDATIRSNLSVAPPIDLLCYREGSLRVEVRVDIAEDDAYFAALRADYSRGLLELFEQWPEPGWIATSESASR
jgi:putative proteasome-type protease